MPDSESETLTHNAEAGMLNGVCDDSDDGCTTEEDRDSLDLVLSCIPVHVIRY